MFVRGTRAATLTQHDDGTFSFGYIADYLADERAPAVSLTLPKTRVELISPDLPAACFQLLPEGHNKKALCTLHRIDPSDEFSILLRVAQVDSVGVVTVQAIGDE